MRPSSSVDGVRLRQISRLPTVKFTVDKRISLALVRSRCSTALSTRSTFSSSTYIRHQDMGESSSLFSGVALPTAQTPNAELSAALAVLQTVDGRRFISLTRSDGAPEVPQT